MRYDTIVIELNLSADLLATPDFLSWFFFFILVFLPEKNKITKRDQVVATRWVRNKIRLKKLVRKWSQRWWKLSFYVWRIWITCQLEWLIWFEFYKLAVLSVLVQSHATSKWRQSFKQKSVATRWICQNQSESLGSWIIYYMTMC